MVVDVQVKEYVMMLLSVVVGFGLAFWVLMSYSPDTNVATDPSHSTVIRALISTFSLMVGMNLYFP